MTGTEHNHFDAVRAVLAADLPPSAKLVLLALHDRQGQNGASWPSLTRLSRDTHLCRDTVVRAISTLRAKGLVTIEKPGRPSVRACNRYAVQTSLLSGLVRKTDQSENQTATGTKIRPQLVRESDSNAKGNDSLNGPGCKSTVSTTRRRASVGLVAEGVLGHWNAQAFLPVLKLGDDGHSTKVQWKKHRQATAAIRAAVAGATAQCSVETVKAAISNYAAVLKDPASFWTHSWTLTEFLTRKHGSGKGAFDPFKWWQFTPDEFDAGKYRRRADEVERAGLSSPMDRAEAERLFEDLGITEHHGQEAAFA